jgi:hypothetical protein
LNARRGRRTNSARVVARLLVAWPILFLATLPGCRRAPAPPPPGTFKKGLALSEIHPGHGEVVYSVALDRIKSMNAGWVLLPVYGYMDSAAAAVVDTDWEPPVDAAQYRGFVRQLVREAHDRNLAVLVIPYLNLRYGPPSDWRGNIHPADWNAWFASYRVFLDGWVDLARSEKVEMLAVGAELVSSEDSTEAWRRIISGVRSHYTGRVIYSFNWDHYSEAAFHRDLDAIGVSGYYSLPHDLPLTEASIERNWRDVKEKLVAFSHINQRPLIFTEIGYASVEGSARDPWNYMMEGPVDTAGQAQAIAAFIRVWDGTPELEGVFFWNFSPIRGGPLDSSYSVQGKPAESLIRVWFSRFPIAVPDALR